MDSRNYTELLVKVTANNLNKDLSDKIQNLKKLIDIDIVEFLKYDSPINSSGLYFGFKYEYERMIEFYRFKDINCKQIIALGGGFSTGKSTFINTILKSKLLPAQITATTSVPTYVIKGNDEVQAINLFDSQIFLEKDELKLLTHDSEEANINFGHLLKTIFIKSKDLNFDNIAFLDTPGYSKYDNENYSERTDENIAKVQLNSADYIFWFLNAENGTLSSNDIEFLKDINDTIPIYIVINKCDKTTTSNLNLIQKEVWGKVNDAKLNIKDVLSFSKRTPEKFDIEKVIAILENIDTPKQEENFSDRFLSIFKNVEKYYDDLLREVRSHLNRVNIVLTQSEDEKSIECLKIIQRDYKVKINTYINKIKNLENIWNEFSRELDIDEEKELEFTINNQNSFSDMLNNFNSSENSYSEIVNDRRYWGK
jgi:GTPase Era involved in 16S rRNA processing